MGETDALTAHRASVDWNFGDLPLFPGLSGRVASLGERKSHRECPDYRGLNSSA